MKRGLLSPNNKLSRTNAQYDSHAGNMRFSYSHYAALVYMGTNAVFQAALWVAA